MLKQAPATGQATVQVRAARIPLPQSSESAGAALQRPTSAKLTSFWEQVQTDVSINLMSLRREFDFGVKTVPLQVSMHVPQIHWISESRRCHCRWLTHLSRVLRDGQLPQHEGGGSFVSHHEDELSTEDPKDRLQGSCLNRNHWTSRECRYLG